MDMHSCVCYNVVSKIFIQAYKIGYLCSLIFESVH
jgi:hypothetical protein